MQLSGIFLGLGRDSFCELFRHISLGKLKSYQLFERLKLRLHLGKLNTETLRKAAPRCWDRLEAGGEDMEEFATEISQAVLVSNLEMIKAVLDEIGIPHDDGFFQKDLKSSTYLTAGWQARVYERFRSKYSEPLLLFYINHLGWESGKEEQVFVPGAVTTQAPS